MSDPSLAKEGGFGIGCWRRRIATGSAEREDDDGSWKQRLKAKDVKEEPAAQLMAVERGEGGRAMKGDG